MVVKSTVRRLCHLSGHFGGVLVGVQADDQV
jgi:hypothetical protein